MDSNDLTESKSHLLVVLLFVSDVQTPCLASPKVSFKMSSPSRSHVCVCVFIFSLSSSHKEDGIHDYQLGRKKVNNAIHPSNPNKNSDNHA